MRQHSTPGQNLSNWSAHRWFLSFVVAESDEMNCKTLHKCSRALYPHHYSCFVVIARCHTAERTSILLLLLCVFFRFVFGTILFGPGRSTDGKKIYMETSRHKTRQGSTRVVVAEYSVPYADVDEPRCLCSFVYYCLVPCVCVFGEQLLIRETHSLSPTSETK